MSKYKDYKRFPIMISTHDCLVVHVFSRTDKIEDIFLYADHESKMYSDYEMFEIAAKQLINQLEGNYCDLFLEELIKVCQDKLKKKKE